MDINTHKDEIDLFAYWASIWRRKWLIVLVCMLAMIVTIIISKRSPKYYKSEAVIMSTSSDSGGLGAAFSSSPFAGVLGSAGMQSTTDKIMAILKSRSAAEAVVSRYDLYKVFNEEAWDKEKGAWKDPLKPPLMTDTLDMLMRSVTKFSKNKEGVITIAVEWKDPRLAAEIANYYVYALTDFLKDRSMNITIQTLDRAIPAERKSRPKTLQNMILAGAASFLFCIFYILIVDHIGKRRTMI